MLTTKRIDNARAEDTDRYLTDRDGLRLRIKRSGEKSWELRYYFGGKRQTLGIGSYPEIGLKDARARTDELRRLVALGTDPKEHLAAEVARRIAEQREREAKAQAEALEKSVRGLYDDWMRSYVNVHRKRPGHVESFMEADVLPYIGKIKARDVRKAHVVEIIERMVNRGAKVKADRVLSMIKQMFTHGVGKGIIDTHPCADLHRKHLGIKTVSNKRHLAEDEIIELLRKLPASGLPERIQSALVLLLTTGQRTGELRQAKWPDIDFDARLWTIPAEHSKNGKPHKVHLSNLAVRHFEVLRSYATSSLVLESTRNEGEPMDEKTLSKMVSDRQRSTPLKNRTGACDSLMLSGGKWSPHHLRHTANTGMGGLGIAPYVVEKILNHTMPGIMAVYNHAEYLAERADALDRWGEYLDRLQNADLSNVITLRRTA